MKQILSMKLWGLLLMAVMTIGFLASCGDDDDDSEANNPNSIIGLWKYEDRDFWITYNFKSNGKCIYKGSRDGFTYTWRTVGDFLVLKQDLEEVYVYEINNGMMKLWFCYEKNGNMEDVDVEQMKKKKPSQTFIKQIDK